MTDRVRIAAAQINPQFMKNEYNLNKIQAASRQAKDKGADLVVFPECALTGYSFNNREEAVSCAETVPGPATDSAASLCQELNLYVIFGLLEKDEGKLFNAAVLAGPQGLAWKYRKNHVPFQGVDRFVDRGDGPFRVYQVPIGNIGMQICYDIFFPESARVHALLGADIITLPTNFATKGVCDRAAPIITARAIENKVHVLSCNRVGVEGDYPFCGLSKIVDPMGITLAEASPDREEIIVAELSLEEARQKRITHRPGEWEIDRMKDRRPELYSRIVQP